MSNTVNRGFKKLRKWFDPSYQKEKLKDWVSSDSPNPAPVQPGEPTIDEAAKNRDATDRLKRRKGVLANVFGGGSKSSTSSVGTKTLLGG